VTDGEPRSIGPFSVLVICTANVCRSPAAEIELGAALRPSGVRVASAGLRARAGQAMAPEIARLLDVSADDVIARQLTPGMIREADLVLTMTRRQRSAVVASAPPAVRRTFTLHEFAGLAALVRDAGEVPDDGSPVERLAAVTLAAPRFRSYRSAGEDDDIEDPFERGEDAYAHAVQRVRECVATLAEVLLGSPDLVAADGGSDAL
jgi:protein-tyrosine phosphatase